MNNDSNISFSLSESINDNILSILSNASEIALDSILEDGLLKEIPFFTTLISVYHIGHQFSELHYLKKLAIFIDEINKNSIEEDKRKHYIKKLTSKTKKMNKDLEYILILVNRYLDYYKPRFLAKLYLEYLDNHISWNEFSEYAELIDRLLLSDFNCLCEFMFHGGVMINQNIVDVASVLRLQSIGFVKKNNEMIWHEIDNSIGVDFDYCITNFGKVFASLFDSELREIHEQLNNE